MVRKPKTTRPKAVKSVASKSAKPKAISKPKTTKATAKSVQTIWVLVRAGASSREHGPFSVENLTIEGMYKTKTAAQKAGSALIKDESHLKYAGDANADSDDYLDIRSFPLKIKDRFSLPGKRKILF